MDLSSNSRINALLVFPQLGHTFLREIDSSFCISFSKLGSTSCGLCCGLGSYKISGSGFGVGLYIGSGSSSGFISGVTAATSSSGSGTFSILIGSFLY